MNYIERMEEEVKELHERAEKLEKFLHNGTVELDDTQRRLLKDQHYYMYAYEKILKQRIAYEKAVNNK